MTNQVNYVEEMRRWALSARGIGPSGVILEGCAAYIERLEKALVDIRNDAIRSIHDGSMLMSLPPRNPLASRILYQHLVDDRFGVVDEPEPKT